MSDPNKDPNRDLNPDPGRGTSGDGPDRNPGHGAMDDRDKEIAKLKDEAAANRIAAKKLQEKLDEIEEEKRLARENKARDEGRYQELLEEKEGELTTYRERAETAEAAIQKYFEAELETVPEDKRDLIPEGPVARSLEWLQKAKAKGLFGETRIGPGVRDGGELSGDVTSKADLQTSAEKAAFINKHGRDAYLKLPAG